MTLLNSTCSPFLAAAADYKIKPQENLYAPHGINNLILRGHATRPFVNIPMPHSYAEALLISEKERERLKTTTTTLSLSSISQLASRHVCEWWNHWRTSKFSERRRGTMTKTMTAIVQAEIGMMHSICDLLPMLSAYMAIKYFLLTYLIIMQLC